MHFRLVHFNTIESTSVVAATVAREGISEGTAITCDFQTQGRGRHQRVWVSPRGENVLCSLVLRPPIGVSRSPMLTYLAARVVRETLQHVCKVTSVLKKPNDVLVNGRKICGILTETHSRAHRVDYVIVGIGLNINSVRENLLTSATSVFEETGIVYAPSVVLAAVLKLFSHAYAEFLGRKALAHDTDN